MLSLIKKTERAFIFLLSEKAYLSNTTMSCAHLSWAGLEYELKQPLRQFTHTIKRVSLHAGCGYKDCRPCHGAPLG